MRQRQKKEKICSLCRFDLLLWVRKLKKVIKIQPQVNNWVRGKRRLKVYVYDEKLKQLWLAEKILLLPYCLGKVHKRRGLTIAKVCLQHELLWSIHHHRVSLPNVSMSSLLLNNKANVCGHVLVVCITLVCYSCYFSLFNLISVSVYYKIKIAYIFVCVCARVWILFFENGLVFLVIKPNHCVRERLL